MCQNGLEQFLQLARSEPELGLSVARIITLENGAVEALVALIERHGFTCSYSRAAAYVEVVRGQRSELSDADLDGVAGGFGQLMKPTLPTLTRPSFEDPLTAFEDPLTAFEDPLTALGKP